MGDSASKEPSVLYDPEPDSTSADSDKDDEVIKVMDVDGEVLEHCSALKLKCSDIKWAMFRIKDKKTIVIDKTLEWNEFDSVLPKDRDTFLTLKKLLVNSEPRYILYNFNIMTEEGKESEHLAFIYWCDAHCDVREKSLYDSSKDVIIQQFGGSIVEFEACHEDSIDYDAYVHVIKSKQKMNYLIPFLHKE